MPLRPPVATALRVAGVTCLFLTVMTGYAGAQMMSYNKWKIDVTPYFWLSGAKGNATVEGMAFDIDESFSDLSKLVSWSIAGHVEARKRVWALILDVRYRDLDTQEEMNSTDVANIIVETSVGYKVLDWPKSSVEVIGGLWYFNTRIEVRDAPNAPSDEANWVDPMIGGRATWKLSKVATFAARADVGGFNIGSNISWNASGVFAYRMYDFSVVLGYRVWSVDYETGSGSDLFTYDVVTHGPGVGFTFHFGG